jgi:hypothetical protein
MTVVQSGDFLRVGISRRGEEERRWWWVDEYDWSTLYAFMKIGQWNLLKNFFTKGRGDKPE